MTDLDIHERLTAGSPTVEELRQQMAAWPLARRAAYIGMVAPFTTDADAAVRKAALDALAGARGVGGVRGIVTALADGEVSVRTAAVAALREVARDAPERYAHALFHASPDVRRAALAGELPINAAKLAIYLRADREVADLVQTIPWPSDSLGIALRALRPRRRWSGRGDRAAHAHAELGPPGTCSTPNTVGHPRSSTHTSITRRSTVPGRPSGTTSSTVSSARSARPGTSARSST